MKSGPTCADLPLPDERTPSLRAAGAKIEQWIRPPTIISLPEQLNLHKPGSDGVTEEQAEAVAYAGAAALFGGDDGS